MRAGQWVHFGLHYAKDAQIHITIFDRKGHSHFVIKLPRYVHIHDFFLTESYLIFNLHPMEIGLFDFLSGRKSLAESFRWRPENGNLLMILSKDGGSPPIYIETAPVFMWHSINSFQHKDAIISDFIGYKSPDHFLGSNSPIYAVMRGKRGFYKDRGEIKRYIIEPKKKQVSESLLYEGSGYEWPSIDPIDRCYSYRFAYAARARDGDFFGAGLLLWIQKIQRGLIFSLLRVVIALSPYSQAQKLKGSCSLRCMIQKPRKIIFLYLGQTGYQMDQ